MCLGERLCSPRKPLYSGICIFGSVREDRILAVDFEAETRSATFDPGANWFMDRMVISPDGRELLVAAAARSVILNSTPILSD